MINVDVCLIVGGDRVRGTTVGEIRQFLKDCESLGIGDDAVLDEATLYLVAYSNVSNTYMLQCGEHYLPQGGTYPLDLGVSLHNCEEWDTANPGGTQ